MSKINPAVVIFAYAIISFALGMFYTRELWYHPKHAGDKKKHAKR